MPKSPITEKFKSLMPYFLLSLLIIAAYRISGELSFFFNFFGLAWGVISPFFYGFLLAYVINIPCSSLQRLLSKTNNKFIVKRKKSISLVIVLLALVAMIFLALNMVIPAIRSSVEALIEAVPGYLEDVTRFIDGFDDLELFGEMFSTEGILGFLGGWLTDLSWETLMAPVGAIVGAANAIFRGAITFIASIYIMIEKERCKAYINKLLRIFATPKTREMTAEIFSGLNKNLRQYIHTQTIGGVILAVMSMVVLVIMGSPYILLIGVMLWVANYIPYFGSIVATIIAVLIVAFTQGLTMGLIAAVLLILVQQIEVNIIQPKLMSDAFHMSPLLVIISISIGGAIAGILGMIMVIPIVAVLKDLLDNIVAYYERMKFGVVESKEGGNQ